MRPSAAVVTLGQQGQRRGMPVRDDEAMRTEGDVAEKSAHPYSVARLVKQRYPRGVSSALHLLFFVNYFTDL